MKLTSSLSRREKLLLGLLTSTLIFSASFSYGAVNQSKVDSIMKMINDGAMKFSDIPTAGQTQSERASYYAKVDAGLGDAVEMLAVVRNNIRSLMGLSPAYTADEVVGGIISGVLGGTTGGNTGGGNGNGGNTGGAQITSLCPAGQNYPDYVYTSGRTEVTPFDPNRTYTIELNIKNISTKGLSTSQLPQITTAEAPKNLSATKYITISKNPCDFSSNAKIFYTDVVDGWRYFSINDTRTDNGVINLTPGKWYINMKLSGPCVTPGLPAGSPNQSNCGSFIEIPSGGYGYIGTSGGSSNPPISTSPPVVVNPIANYPIPAPCMAGTVLNKELMGTANGGWIRREFPKGIDIVPGHVYKLRVDESDGLDGGISWSDAPPERIVQAIKISPYPCDFVTLEEEKKYWGGRITVAASLRTWWDSIVVPPTTQVSTCMGIGNSSGIQYKVSSTFTNPSLASGGNCTLVKGVTYYVNIRPSFTFMHGNGCNGPYACNYDLIDAGSQKTSADRPFWGGNYSQYTQLRSTENVESLRQKVVSDYKTKGVNTDGLTNVALGGTAVTPAGGNPGGGPVVVREGPWERVEDIFCPDTLDGPGGLRTIYPNGYNYYNQGNTYWNVKDYNKPADETLPTTCTTGKKFVKHGMQTTCYVYECKN